MEKVDKNLYEVNCQVRTLCAALLNFELFPTKASPPYLDPVESFPQFLVWKASLTQKILFRVGDEGWRQVTMTFVGLNDNRANSVQLELELGLSLAKTEEIVF